MKHLLLDAVVLVLVLDALVLELLGEGCRGAGAWGRVVSEASSCAGGGWWWEGRGCRQSGNARDLNTSRGHDLHFGLGQTCLITILINNVECSLTTGERKRTADDFAKRARAFGFDGDSGANHLTWHRIRQVFGGRQDMAKHRPPLMSRWRMAHPSMRANRVRWRLVVGPFGSQ